MSRQIKFRGYQPELRGWVYGDLIQVPGWGSFIFEWKGNFENRVKVDPDSVGQLTGYKDKNDKDIYEGDIIRISNFQVIGFRNDNDIAEGMSPVEIFEDIECEVSFDEAMFGVESDDHGLIPLTAFNNRDNDIEVVGDAFTKTLTQEQ